MADVHYKHIIYFTYENRNEFGSLIQSIIYFIQQPILRLPKDKRFSVTNQYNIEHNILDVKRNYSVWYSSSVGRKWKCARGENIIQKVHRKISYKEK